MKIKLLNINNNKFICSYCGCKMEMIITPELASKDLVKLVCPKCNNK